VLAGTALAAGTLALAGSPAGAADPALSVSATSGAGGTTLTIGGSGCASDAGHDRLVRAILRTGTAPGDTFAGFAEAWEGEDGLLTVPNWVDPDQPAVIEAACLEYAFDTEDAGPTVAFTFDPVAFDVLPGGGPAETATPARTTVKGGQLLRIDVTGCAVDPEAEDSPYLDVLVFPGDDPSGRSFDIPVETMETGLGVDDGGAVWAYVSPGRDDEGVPTPDGTYTAVVTCSTPDGSARTYQPFAFTVDGSAPTDDVHLAVAPGTSHVTLSGGGCTAGDVTVGMVAFPYEPGDDEPTFDGPMEGLRATRRGPGRWSALRAPSASARMVEDQAAGPDGEELPSLDTTVTPDADGNWSVEWDAGIDHGDVLAFAQCGDPFADGFAYEVQDAAIDIPPPMEATPIAEPAAPTAPGATPIAGRPDFTG
jgi:hypothetical protein